MLFQNIYFSLFKCIYLSPGISLRNHMSGAVSFPNEIFFSICHRDLWTDSTSGSNFNEVSKRWNFRLLYYIIPTRVRFQWQSRSTCAQRYSRSLSTIILHDDVFRNNYRPGVSIASVALALGRKMNNIIKYVSQLPSYLPCRPRRGFRTLERRQRCHTRIPSNPPPRRSMKTLSLFAT